MIAIQTDRLILRSWKEEDLKPFAELNADPHVMEYFPAILSKVESDQMVKRMQAKIEERGWGLWAVSKIETQSFIGFIGFNDVDQSTLPVPFTPAVEIGWRLGFSHWGKGYATEGATACLKHGFQILGLDEIVSFTAKENTRSRRVMERIGLHHNLKDDFDHPKVQEGDRLKKHVLYRLNHSEWKVL